MSQLHGRIKVINLVKMINSTRRVIFIHTFLNLHLRICLLILEGGVERERMTEGMGERARETSL